MFLYFYPKIARSCRAKPETGLFWKQFHSHPVLFAFLWPLGRWMAWLGLWAEPGRSSWLQPPHSQDLAQKPNMLIWCGFASKPSLALDPVSVLQACRRYQPHDLLSITLIPESAPWPAAHLPSAPFCFQPERQLRPGLFPKIHLGLSAPLSEGVMQLKCLAVVSAVWVWVLIEYKWVPAALEWGHCLQVAASPKKWARNVPLPWWNMSQKHLGSLNCDLWHLTPGF